MKHPDTPPRYLLTAAELAKLSGHTLQGLTRILPKERLYHLAGGKLGIPLDEVRAFLEQRGTRYHFTSVAHINLRGGIGKTTSSICLATRAAQYGFKTCLLDLDPQASASLAFAVMADADTALFYDVWQRPAETLVPALIQVDAALYLLPSSLDNTLLDASLQKPADQKRAVQEVCRVLRAHGFDLVVIDCPPALNTAVISSVCAVDHVVIPMSADAFSFRGLDLTLQEIGSICDAFQLRPPALHTLLTRYNKRESLNAAALERLRNEYAEYQLPMVIRASTALSKALERRETVFADLRQDPAREDYDAYTRHLLGIHAQGGTDD